jgi:hypothetical protein
MRTKIAVSIVIFSLLFIDLEAQFRINSVGFFGDYSTILTKKSELKVNSMKGPGGEIEVMFDLYKNFKLSVNAGYKNLNVDQDVHALFAQWNWKSWKRYYGDINDTNLANFNNKYVQLLLADTANYAAAFTPVQTVEIYPLIATFSYQFNATENLIFRPSFGAGVIFFYKSLYVEEHWKKFFNQLSGYIFDYSYRNMSEKISGNPYVFAAGIEADYRIYVYILLSAGLRYTYLMDTGSKYGYEDFTSKDLLNVKLGLSFEY